MPLVAGTFVPVFPGHGASSDHKLLTATLSLLAVLTGCGLNFGSAHAEPLDPCILGGW